jgi:hypothetical protein
MPPHQQPGDQQVKRDTFARLAAEADEMEALIASVICRHQTIGPSLDPNPLQYPRRFLAPRPECAADVGSPLRQGSSLPLTLNFPYALPPHGFRIRLTGRVPERIRGGGATQLTWFESKPDIHVAKYPKGAMDEVVRHAVIGAEARISA